MFQVLRRAVMGPPATRVAAPALGPGPVPGAGGLGFWVIGMEVSRLAEPASGKKRTVVDGARGRFAGSRALEFIPTAMTSDEQQLMEVVQRSGRMGNQKARATLGWSEEQYRAVRDALVAEGQQASMPSDRSANKPEAADRLGVVYTPNEIVRVMIRSTDQLLHRHFGRTLSGRNVEILDPATGPAPGSIHRWGRTRG